jgi:hypothetical protein
MLGGAEEGPVIALCQLIVGIWTLASPLLISHDPHSVHGYYERSCWETTPYTVPIVLQSAAVKVCGRVIDSFVRATPRQDTGRCHLMSDSEDIR